MGGRQSRTSLSPREMRHANDAWTPDDSNQDTQGAKTSEGDRSPGGTTTKKPGLSLTGPFKACNEDFEHITPPATPTPRTEASSPTEAKVVPFSQQLSPLPPTPPEADNSVRDYLQSYGNRNHAASGRHDRPSRSHGEIWEEVNDAASSAQACGRGMELGKAKSGWNSSDQVTPMHSTTDGERDVVLGDGVTFPGPSFTQHRARNDFPNGCSGPSEIKGARKGAPDNFVDSKEGGCSSALNHEFLHSSGDESTAGFADGEESRHEHIASGWLDDEDEDVEEERFSSQSGGAMSRSLLPKTSGKSERLTQTGIPNAPKPFSFYRMARARAIADGMLENGERQEPTISNRDLTVQALANHDAAISSALSPNASSRFHRIDKTNSVLRQENASAANGTFSVFSSMSSRGGSSVASSEVHDLMEELDGSDIEDKVDRNNTTENTEGAAVLHGNGAGKGCGDQSLPMEPLYTEGTTSLSNNGKLSEAMLLVDDLNFGKLPLIRQAELLRDVSTVYFAKGEVIFSEGEPSDALYFILDRTDSVSDKLSSKGWRQARETSKLEVSGKKSGESEEFRLREFVPSGRIFGEEGLIYSTKHKRCSTIRAAADMSCAVIRAPAFPHWWEFRLSLLMKKVAMLSQLSTTTRMEVLDALKYANYQPGETIVAQGEPGHRFYIITRGTAIVSTRTSRDPFLASSSASEDDSDADKDIDALFDAGISSTHAKGYTTYQLHTGKKNGRKHVIDGREGCVASAESVKGEDCDVSNGAMTDAKSQSVPLDRVVVSDKAVAPKPTQSLLPPPPTNAGEKLLTRLYEGNTFGEMELVYDEPRTVTVRAVTEVTCLFLEKGAFQTCLHDNAFHKLMEQATLQRPYYSKHREVIFRQQLGLTLEDELEIWQPGSSARARRPLERNARSSFRLTVKMKRKGKNIPESGHLVNDYRVCKKVGKGSYGAVYKVVNVLTSKVYAMKVVNKPSKSGEHLNSFERDLMREVSALKVLRHPNVVTLWEVIDDSRSRKVYMIQEFMEGGSLLREDFNVEPMPEKVALTVFIQVTKGLQYIHSYGVCHGDIKPSNILVDHNGTVKIADFGSCVLLDQDTEDEDGDSSGDSSCSSRGGKRRKTNGKNPSWRKPAKRIGQRLHGTPGFQAPELFEEDGISRVSFASDVWALGITLYQMVVGRMPFFGSSFRALMSAIKTEELNFPAGYYVEPFLVNLLHRMLRKNPATRITLDEAVRHEWVKGEGLLRPRFEHVVQKDAEYFRMRASAYRARTSLGSASPKLPRRSSSSSRLSTMDPLAMTPQESRNPSIPIDASTRWCDNGQERKFSPCSVETLVDKRRSIFPLGVIDDAQEIVLTTPSMSCEVGYGCGKEEAPTPQASNSNRGLPCAGMLSETPVLGSSHPGTQEYPQLPSIVNTTDSPSLGGTPIGNEDSWSELKMSNLGEEGSKRLRPRSTPSRMWELQEQEQGQQGFLLHHSQLARKPDFLMLKMDPTPMSDMRVVVSAKTGFSVVRPMADGYGGSRRLSSRHVEFNRARTRQEPTRQSVDDPRLFGPCNEQSLEGGPSGDRDSSNSAASLQFKVAERAREAVANAVEEMVGSTESVGLIAPYSTTPIGVRFGHNLTPPDTEGERRPERVRDAPDASGATTGKWNIRTMLPFPSPTRQPRLFTAPQYPTDCIDEEEPEKMPLHKSVQYREQASGGEASKETGDSSSSLGGGYGRDANKSSISRTRGESDHHNSDSSTADRSEKEAKSSGLAEKLPLDSRENDAEDGQNNVDSSSEDGLEEETSVVDITDCLDCIDEAGIKRDDKDVSPLDRTEIQALLKSDIPHSWCSNLSGGGSEDITSSPTATMSPQLGEEDFGPVQTRTWGGQVNDEVGVRFGISLNQGNLCFMEDTATCLANVFENNWRETPDPSGVSLASANARVGASQTASGLSQEAASYFAVFDGHGGADVAIYLQDALHQRVLGDSLFPSNIPEAISNGCKAIDLECLEIAHGKRVASSKEENSSSLEVPTLKRQRPGHNFPGAVSIVAIVHRRSLTPPASFDHSPGPSGGTANVGTSDGKLSSASQYHPVFLHVANVGDCRAVLCRAGKAVVVTEDHTPAVASEAMRIEAAGGFVSRGRVNGILGVSRSFGDIHCKDYPLREGQDLWDDQQVISRPEVHSIEVTPADSFLILACDGVWGVLSNQQAVSFVHRRLLIHKDVQRAATELIDKALDVPSYDNCSCIIICLNQNSLGKNSSSRLSFGKSSGSIGLSRKSSASSAESGDVKRRRRSHA